MNQGGMNVLLAAFYLVLWIATFVWYHFKHRSVDAGTGIIGMYIVYAVFSIMSLFDPIFSEAYEPLRLFPYLYLYVMMMIALSPVIYNHYHPASRIEDPHTRIFVVLAIVVFVCGVFTLPSIFSGADGGVAGMVSDGDAGKEAYMDQIDATGSSGSKINNLAAVIFNALSDFPAFLLFYFLTKEKKNKFIILTLAISIFIGILAPMTKGQRGGTVTGMLTVLGAYLLFKRYLSQRINRFVKLVGVSLVIMVSIPIAMITLSRFGKEQAGVAGFVNWYIGQGSLYFNNYGLDDGGTREGSRTMNLFKRFIDADTPKNFVERRDKYRNLEIDDNFFSTFVGDFTIDFGPVIPVAIFLVFNGIVISMIRPKDDQLKVSQLLVLYLPVCISLQGGMTLYSYSDLSALRLLALFGLYAYLRYHDKLLVRFPLSGVSRQSI